MAAQENGMDASSVRFVGIDLGTTYSSIAFINNDGKAELINFNNNSSEPSWIMLQMDANYEKQIIFGDSAKNKAKEKEATIYDFKRVIGRPFDQVFRESSNWPFKVCDDGSNIPCIKMKPAGSKEEEIHRAEVLSAWLMRYLFDQYVKKSHVKLKETIHNIVVTIPADYSPAYEEAMEKACLLAGFKKDTGGNHQNGDIILKKMVSEPEAALHHFKTKNDGKLKDGEYVLVCDFGGGTFDLSVAFLHNGKLVMIMKQGFNTLGGNNFDDVMFELIKRGLNENYKVDLDKFEMDGNYAQISEENQTKVKQLRVWLKQQAEIVKKKLSSDDSAPLTVGDPWSEILEMGKNETITISKKEFEMECGMIDIIDDEMDDLLIPKIIKALTLFSKEVEAKRILINYILLIGGTCHMPMVKKTIEDHLRHICKDKTVKFLNSEDRDFGMETAVCYGACKYSEDLHSMKSTSVGAVGSNYLTENIGIEVEGSEMYFIARKGDYVDSRSKALEKSITFKLSEPDQDYIDLTFYSGNHRYSDVLGMMELGRLTIDVNEYLKDDINRENVIFQLTIMIKHNGNIEMKNLEIFSTSQKDILKKEPNVTDKWISSSLFGYSRHDMQKLVNNSRQYKISGMNPAYSEIIEKVMSDALQSKK